LIVFISEGSKSIPSRSTSGADVSQGNAPGRLGTSWSGFGLRSNDTACCGRFYKFERSFCHIL